MEDLFATFEIPPPTPREHAKRRKGQEEDEDRIQKKERCDIQAGRRASLADEEAHRLRVAESAAGVSSSTDVAIAGGTVDSVVAYKDTTEGVQSTKVVDFEELDPPNC